MLSGQAWTGVDIDVDAVLSAVERQDLEDEPWTVYESRSPESQGEDAQQWDADYQPTHIRRIAHFVHHGVPTDDEDPIRMNVCDIELGVGLKEQDGPYTLNIAGRHRLAAAVIRGDETVEITFTGDQSVIKNKLPGAEPLQDHAAVTPSVSAPIDFTP